MFDVSQNPCDLHNSKTINTTDVQSALYIIQLCFTQAKYNLWYILVHQPAFGLGLSAYRQSKQSKCNLHNPNTNETIQMQSTESFLAQLFCHKGGGGCIDNTTPHCTKSGNCTIQIQLTQSKYNWHNPNTIVESKYNRTIQIQLTYSNYNRHNSFWHKFLAQRGYR